MTTEKLTPSRLIHQFVARWDTLQRLQKEQEMAAEELEKAATLILENERLASVLKETGVAVGSPHRQRRVRYEKSQEHMGQPLRHRLRVFDPPEMPYSWELDDLLKEEKEVPGDE